MDGFPTLFSPIDLGGINLKNRLIMSLYPTKYVEDGLATERMIEFFRARAAGGVGLIVLDGACLDYPVAYKGPTELRMDTEDHAAGLKRLLAAIHGQESRAFMHLNYPSSLSVDEGKPGAVLKKGRWMLPLVSAADGQILDKVIKAFGTGAARAREIGYDGVEVQAGWGDLVAQFLSPVSNKRGDRYGGELVNRARLLIQIVTEVKTVAGSDYPLQIKLSVDELIPGGFSLEDAKTVVDRLQKAGADSILTTVGNKKTKSRALPAHTSSPGVSVSYAAAVKSIAQIPVIAMGKINGPALAERILRAGQADLVAMTRALIADPDLPLKAQNDQVEDIRGCIYCLDDCADKGVPGLGRACTNNPLAGLEHEIKVGQADRPQRVWVIGGGPAGMQAAMTAAEQGHSVRLSEEHSHLGGQFRLASIIPHKAEVSEVVRWLETQLFKSTAEVDLNHRVDAEEIISEQPDAVILATGSEPKAPLVPGIGGPNIFEARQYLKKTAVPGENVVVMGGGDVGCEVALHAANSGSRVTVVEILPQVMSSKKSLPRAEVLEELLEKKVAILTDCAVSSLNSGMVTLMTQDGQEKIVAADTVIYAVGSNPRRDLYHDLLGKIDIVHLVGDAEEPGNLGHALRTALRVAVAL